MFWAASDFFQYFNPSNACLQAVDLIEFFLSKLSLILKKVTLCWGARTVETAICSKPLYLARSKPKFEPYRLHAVLVGPAPAKSQFKRVFLRLGEHALFIIRPAP